MDVAASSVSYILDSYVSSSYSDFTINYFATAKIRPVPTLWSSPFVVAFLTLVRMFGGLPFCKFICLPKTPVSLSTFWYLFLCFITVCFATVDTLKSVLRYRQRLNSLEFTAISMVVCRASYILKTFVIVTNLFVLRKKLHFLLDSVSKVCMISEDERQHSKEIRRKVRWLAGLLTAVGVSSVGILLVALYLCFRGLVTKPHDGHPGSWNCPTAFPVFGEVPMWASFLAYMIGMFWEVGIDVFPQLLIIFLIYPLGLRFRNFTRSVEEKLRTEDSWFALVREDAIDWKQSGPTLRSLTTLHLELTIIVREFDTAFSFMFCLMYMNDLMSFIASVSLIIHHCNGLSGSIDLELMPVFLSLVGVSSFHAVLRTGFGVWLSEKAHSVLPFLYQLNLRVTTDEDKFLCSSFISRLQGSRVALTAGGFFYITREFVITIFGVLLTYILFVYQMQDQKTNMSLLPKLEEIAAVAFASARTPNQLTLDMLYNNATS